VVAKPGRIDLLTNQSIQPREHIETAVIDLSTFALAHLRISESSSDNCQIYGRIIHDGQASSGQPLKAYKDVDMRASYLGDSPLALDFFLSASCNAPVILSAWLEVVY
jgi:hypothetical protein